MRRFGGTAGGVSTRFRGFEDRILKLGAFGTWLCCVLLIGLGVSPSATAQATVTYIHTDALGSVVAESDANGNVIKRHDYEPYGAVVGGEVTDGPGYAGHVSDLATGLSYMQQRYMEPQLGVFLSVDPVTAYYQPVGQFNRYRYANGNPYRLTDPDGRQAGPTMGPVSAMMTFQCVYIARKTGDGAKSGSNREAHRAAQREANPVSIKQNREYGGKTYKTSDDRYGFTRPTAGSDAGLNPSAVSVPNGTLATGDYHAHGDYSVADSSGGAMRTGDFARDSFNGDQSSAQDLRGITADAVGRVEYIGSLGNPSGKVYEYNPKDEFPEPKRIDWQDFCCICVDFFWYAG